MTITNRFYKHRFKGFRTFVIILVVIMCIILLSLQLTSFQPDDYLQDADLARQNAPEGLHRNHQNQKANDQWSIFLYGSADQHAEQLDSLSTRIENLKRIKVSLSNELRLMERDKQKLIRDKNNLISRNDKLLAQISKSKLQLKQLELDISANRRQKFEKSCDSDWVAPIVFNPMKSVDMVNYTITSHHPQDISEPSDSLKKKEEKVNLIDYSLCPLTSLFKFTIAETNQIQSNNSKDSPEKIKLNSSDVQKLLQSHQSYTSDGQTACLFINLIRSSDEVPENNQSNNLVINLSTGDSTSQRSHKDQNFLLADSSFETNTYRANFDLIVPSIWQHPDAYNSIVGSIPPQSPISRKYLASYFGQNSNSSQALSEPEQILLTMHRNSIDDLFLFMYECSQTSNEMCYESRERMLEMSTFLVIIPKNFYIIDENTNDLIYLALAKGTIPVIIGSEKIRLPFDGVIDWRLASLLLPTPRLPELHFILRSFGAADIYQMKYHGRRIFEEYLATAKQIIDTIVSIVSVERLNYPPAAIQDFPTVDYFANRELNYDTNCSTNICQETQTDSVSSMISAEILGPREKPFSSQAFRRNFSLVFNSNYDLWNSPLYNPKYLFPNHPLDPLPPSEYKFLTTNSNYRPINEGLGGSGVDFSRSLGGDYPNEQFTIVLLTYERRLLLMKTLERLKNLAYLNKLVIVWNGIHEPPPSEIIWPDVGVPIVLVKVEQNSLNNRFLPFDVIETDAIFSMDDDSPLRPDEIVFAFRVWRQSRDRIVGFPGRFHAWDPARNTWLYDSNHSCELSMVLTGGAFFHKYYTYAYSYFMPNSIRSIVDKFMNCEDIAMNFLVAHLTRKPPIKVTSRWTFHCPNCASSLSEDDSHFRERHECLNIFASIYGYMPLLNTQHRSDSILFKTRLPSDKQKCFRFV